MTGPRPKSRTMLKLIRCVFQLTAVALASVAFADAAFACACCTNPGQRYVEVVQLDSGRRDEIESLRFAKSAELYVGEAGVEIVQGIATPSERYDVDVKWENGHAKFALRDEAGHEGTLTLAVPDKITIFEVDPRDSPGQGTEPTLYKEWKLTGRVTGAGVFNTGSEGKPLLTLILQGRGNSCTSAADFTHWTLVMQGTKGYYTLFGALAKP